ncbi:hypothetical protein VT84_38495 [Gemmata sp. SH-PL17]|uniref:Uncharacterized protein n=1 Tax=Gemmata massiliana TaxID=1210884 RepID=A0A6P2CS23_9BACT|nr:MULTISPECIES: hypothetical protein [Gemmata]AMV30346.1 hypothetical protein VT84_38495 [Gemmata sp. SH-PL17]VTR90895.1 unnamed protein product [Gemmata massiliana]
MARSHKVLGFLLVTILGVYGCAKAPSSASTESNAASAKVQKLEEEYRGAIAARDQLRQKLAASEELAAKTKKELEQTQAAAATERDALKTEVKARTGERDALQTQFESFRKTLRDMLGSADTAVSKLNLPATQPVMTSLGARN